MFFTKILNATLQTEWSDLIKGTTFESEWDKCKINKNINELYIVVKSLSSILESKTVSEELRNAIKDTLNGVLDTYNDKSDLNNLIRLTINKIDYALQSNNLNWQKNQITYSLGSQNLQPVFADTFVTYFGQTWRHRLTNHSNSIGLSLLCILAGGLYYVNQCDYNPRLMLAAQLALIACVSGMRFCTSPSVLSAYELRERHQSLVNQLRYILPKLEQINTDIKLVEGRVFANNSRRLS